MNLVERVIRWWTIVGVTVLIGLLGVVVVNVFGRMVGRPVPGTYELVEVLGAIGIAGVLGYTAILGRHIGVDIFVRHLPQKAQGLLLRGVNLVSAAVLGIVAWRLLAIAQRSLEEKATTDILSVPLGWVYYFVGISFILTSLAFLIRAIKPLARGQECPQ